MTQERISLSESIWPGFYEHLEPHPLYLGIGRFPAHPEVLIACEGMKIELKGDAL